MLLPALLATVLHASSPLASAPLTTPAADSLTGTWQVTGDVMGSPVNERCTLKQTGAAVTGTCRNTDAPDAKAFDVTGEVKDGRVTFRHGGDYQGQALTIAFSGALAATRTLTGTIDVQPFGVGGTFTAAPPTAAAPAPASPAPAPTKP